MSTTDSVVLAVFPPNANRKHFSVDVKCGKRKITCNVHARYVPEVGDPCTYNGMGNLVTLRGEIVRRR